MKILCTTATFNKSFFPKNFNVLYNPYNRKLDENEILELIESYDPVGIIAGVEPITKKVLSRAKNLKVISRCGGGLDSIDLEEASRLGIKVLNTPDAPTAAVAELTIGLIIEMLRKINDSDNSIRNGGWFRPMGNLLGNKTVGIIGCGRIGSKVAEILSGFGCEIIGYDSFLKKHNTIKLKTFDQVVKESDIISLHLPYSKEIHHLISDKQFNSMKENSFIVNSSRGGLLDEEALLKHIQSGKIKGAAIDCFEDEPYKGELINYQNVVLSAHIGSYAIESREIQEFQAVENLIKGLTNKKI